MQMIGIYIVLVATLWCIFPCAIALLLGCSCPGQTRFVPGVVCARRDFYNGSTGRTRLSSAAEVSHGDYLLFEQGITIDKVTQRRDVTLQKTASSRSSRDSGGTPSISRPVKAR